jgi:pyruvate kinase
MTKILSTIGPASEGKNLKYFLKDTNLIRLNLSHNTLTWHKATIKKIKKNNPEIMILADIPGIKPRTLNEKTIFIKKNKLVKFSYLYNKNKDVIRLSNPLPKIKKNSKIFYLSDGLYEFKNLKYHNKILQGVSCQNFNLKNKKGLNIPFSIYDDVAQEKLYFSTIKKIIKLDIDCVGISFIQNPDILLRLKKKFPKLIFISKIENYLGYENRKAIINFSDAIMIDRGDLAAEVGVLKLLDYTNDIIKDTKKCGKPIIIATENLNSLIYNNIPTKSDVVNIEYYMRKKVDYLMLSDETATSLNGRNTLKWLSDFIYNKNKVINNLKEIKIEEIIKNLDNQTLVIFSKKGYFYNKINTLDFNNLIFFTENMKLGKNLNLKRNVKSVIATFPKKHLYNFLYKSIKENKKLIFKHNKYAYLLSVIFPRKNSRANSLSIVQEKDFK